jgi:hypothetical protein
MLSIPRSTLGWIVQKAREFDVKEGASSLPDDEYDDPYTVLEDRPGDTAGPELRSWIDDLSESQQAELVAIFWLGRHGGGPAEYAEFLAEAQDQPQGERTATYLLGSPHLADHLESGLEALGYSISDLEDEIA